MANKKIRNLVFALGIHGGDCEWQTDDDCDCGATLFRLHYWTEAEYKRLGSLEKLWPIYKHEGE